MSIFWSSLVLGLIIAIVGLHLVDLSARVHEFLYEPPPNYKLRISNALRRAKTDEKKTPVIDFGWKNGSVRKQLISITENPREYSNVKYANRISIAMSERKRMNLFIESLSSKSNKTIYGFFHPYCNAGGGGEKVLWKAVETTLEYDVNNIVVIYTGDNETTDENILENVISRFGYNLDSDRIVFIFLTQRIWVASESWPKFTLLGQSLGSIWLALEAAFICPPDIWLDTMGYHFTYPIIGWLLKIPVVSYVHYPIISSDMLEKLYCMPKFKSSIKLIGKYIYWKLFILLYQFAGVYVDIIAVNSSWTYNHMKSIWKSNRSIQIIYPPCSTEKLVSNVSDSTWQRKNQAIVIAQFRPEKRHELIIKSYAEYLNTPSHISPMKLILIGSIRGQKDIDYVTKLKNLAYIQLRIPDHQLKFEIDCKYDKMTKYLKESSYGINAMWNEHFGIAIVEYAASGLITLAHASAGPLLDILIPWDSVNDKQAHILTDENRTGLFFRDPSDPDYNKNLHVPYPSLSAILSISNNLTDTQKLGMSQRSKSSVLNRFSDAKFSEAWRRIIDECIALKKSKY